MRTKLIILTLFTICSVSVFSNSSQTNALENSELKKVLKNAKFESGYIIQGKDTVSSNMLVYNRRNKEYSYSFCIVKSPNDSIKAYSPKEISGYAVNNIKYIRHISEGKYIFIELREEGRVNLFSRGRVKNDNRVLYYLKFPSHNDYYVISPDENNLDLQGSADSRINPMMIYRSNDIDLKFKKFVEIYFSDCIEIVYMVNSGFYNISDIPSIVKTYNSCFDK